MRYAPSSSHDYSDAFFEYINAGSLTSGRVVAPIVHELLAPRSLLDVGCGVGAWCVAWRETGVDIVLGVDGEYVDRGRLLMPEKDFHAHDLTKPFELGATFDLVASLEVAEHLSEQSADVFVANLVAHGSVILFSAAVPGQGGEFHVNEQPLEYWRRKFSARGYRCFDPIRRRIMHDTRIEPWYRYNTLLYVSADEVHQLAPEVQASEVATGAPILNVAPFRWRLRNSVIGALPSAWTDQLVRFKHAWVKNRVAQKAR